MSQITAQQSDAHVYAVLHQPAGFSAHSGLFPLVRALGAIPVEYTATHARIGRHSWTLGHWLCAWGIRHYGSTWNSLVPGWDEWRLARRVSARQGDIVHFLWAEFASPRRRKRFDRRGARLVGTFHCSARRQPNVLRAFKCFSAFDRVTVMSQSQIAYLVERGIPSSSIEVTLHGVASDFFTPAPGRDPHDGPLRLLLCGSTERDHETAAAVMRRLQGEPFTLDVLTAKQFRDIYAGLTNVRFLPALDEHQLREAYRQADLFFIPLLDCTANNAVLEAMACGLPVVVNRVGGIPEYVPVDAGLLLDRPSVDDWVSALRVARDPARRQAWGRVARQRAEELDWTKVTRQFRAVYASAGAHS